jgi:protein-S-isoprenylcysteine O-methyltransferase Ste14
MNTFLSDMIILKTLILLIVFPGIVLFYVPYEIVTSSSIATFRLGILCYTAVITWLLGVSISLWCVWDFVSRGRGTPAPIDPPKELVVGGLYKIVRNPMYIGILLILLGHIFWFQSIWLVLYAVCVFIAFHLFVVFYEEPTLRKKFGDSYKRFSQRVPRWIPRVFR